MATLVSVQAIIDIATSKGLSYEQLVTTATHELGHAFGLDHYITDDEELIEKWDQGIDVPSIMIEATDTEKIMKIDLEKIVSIYGNDGFEEKMVVEESSVEIPNNATDKETGFFEWLMNLLHW